MEYQANDIIPLKESDHVLIPVSWMRGGKFEQIFIRLDTEKARQLANNLIELCDEQNRMDTEPAMP